MVVNNMLRQWVRHISTTPGTSPRRSAVRRRHRQIAGGVQPALFHCRIEVLEDRLLLTPSPTITAPASVSVNENAPLTFSTSNNDAIKVADPNASRATEELGLSVTHGLLTLVPGTITPTPNPVPPPTFVGGTKNGSAKILVTGTINQLNVALNGMLDQPTTGYTGADALKIVVINPSDGLQALFTIAITINAPPKITVPAASTVIENGVLGLSSAMNNAIQLTDTAATNGNYVDNVTISVFDGTLALPDTNLLIFGSPSSGAKTIKFQGTVAGINASLANGLSYTPTTGFAGPFDTLSVSVSNPIDKLTATADVTVFVNTWTGLTAQSLAEELSLGTARGTTSTTPTADFALLLSNGDLMVHGGATVSDGKLVDGGATNTWYEVAPDSTGSYANGTWTQLAAMNVARLYFSSVVLPNGDVFVFGGEFANDGPLVLDTLGDTQFSPSAEIWTPPAPGLHGGGTWTMVGSNPFLSTPPFSVPGFENPRTGNYGGDQPAELLSPNSAAPEGRVLIGDVFDDNTIIFTPHFDANGVPLNEAANWAEGPPKALHDSSIEESWVKLANGDILSYDNYAPNPNAANQGQAELYVPAAAGSNGIGRWITADNGNLPILTDQDAGWELGPALLLPNGNAFFAGPTGVIAYYHPASNPSTVGTWTSNLMLPSVLLVVDNNNHLGFQETQLGLDDSGGAILPNGDLLLALSPPDTGGQTPPPTFIYEFDPSTHVFTNVTPPSSISDQSQNSYVDSMLVLPNGQVVLMNQSQNLAFYSLADFDSPNSAWRPEITSFTRNSDGSYTLTGIQLNGLDEGAAYGDDEQVAENYPIVRLVELGLTLNVSYATTSNWSLTGLATGTASETVHVVLPPGLSSGPYFVFAIANGIESVPLIVNLPATPGGTGGNVVTANAANLSQASGVPSAAVSENSSPSPSTASVNATSLSEPAAGSVAPQPESTAGINSNSTTAANPLAAVTPASGTTHFANWLNVEDGLNWAGLNAALELLNA